KAGETYWQAGLRELKEETGQRPLEYWTVPSLNAFYEFQTDMIHHIPAFAARLDPEAEVVLNEEHSEYKWVGIERVRELVPWPEQRRLMHLIYDILHANGILIDWQLPQSWFR
ncbi:NUDIX domain-containing protein, partial [Arthrospira platensis SPKY1]|nr:NUDIX domain-containing protein [Arthrospira platensis SPKY1]